MMKKSIAVFASGSGTNAENIIRYFEDNETIRVSCVLTNNPDAMVIQRAMKLGVPVKIIDRTSFYSTNRIVEFLMSKKIDLIVLAGFLWLVPPNLLNQFSGRVINIHPALLPKYGGKGMYGPKVHVAVSESGDTQSGITIHFVNEIYDAGNSIFQARCTIKPHEEPDSIAEKVHELEYTHYPKVITQVINELP